jgi:hypothetical protein
MEGRATPPERKPAPRTLRPLRRSSAEASSGGLTVGSQRCNRYSPASYLNETRKLRPLRKLAVLREMDILRDNLGNPQIAKRPFAVLMATDAASSQDCVLVPIRSVTL